MALPVGWFAALPAGAYLIAKMAPSVVFAVPKGAQGSSELLKACETLVKRYLSVSVATTAAVMWASLSAFAPPNVPLSSAADRLIYTLKLEAMPLAYYAFCILRVAIGRGGDPKAVMGERTGVSQSVEFASRNLTNTTEQLLLAMASHAALSTVLRPEQCALLPAFVSLWLSGRILFAVGYTPSNPMGRELGFDLTITSSLSALAFFGYKALF